MSTDKPALQFSLKCVDEQGKPREAEDSLYSVERENAPATLGGHQATREVLRVKNEGREPTQVFAEIGLPCPYQPEEDYLLLPAAVYRGNGFTSLDLRYGFRPQDESDETRQQGTIIQRNLPRIDAENSRLEQLGGDLAVPVACIWRKSEGRAVVLMAQPVSEYGSTGFGYDATTGQLFVQFPGYRTRRYHFFTWQDATPDTPYMLAPGAEMRMECQWFEFSCEDVHALFGFVFDVQAELLAGVELAQEFPFSACHSLLSHKLDQCNWAHEQGYYAVGLRNNAGQDWQAGWTGGLINTLPQLCAENGLARERVEKTFDFVTGEGQGSAGFFKSTCYLGEWMSDDKENRELTQVLIRKTADVLYFISKHLAAWRALGVQAHPFPERWLDSLRRCADAFVRLWESYGEWPQYVNWETGERLRAGTASAAIGVAGLVAAAETLEEPRYLDTARDVARHYRTRYLDRGILNGGPGDIMQAIDSESAFGLLESYVILLEATGEAEWLEAAQQTAWQCASWVAAYNFPFPAESTFGRLGIHSAGCVFANVQNKHGSPGICTLSGDSLLKLGRASGDWRYIDLLQVIARHGTQYVSRPDKRIRACNGQIMPDGFANERVNTSDWLEDLGEVFYGSTWAEPAIALMSVELPGIYILTEEQRYWAFDHVEIEQVRYGDGIEAWLTLRNPTAFDARVRIVVEDTATRAAAWGLAGIYAHPCVNLAAGERKSIRVCGPALGSYIEACGEHQIV